MSGEVDFKETSRSSSFKTGATGSADEKGDSSSKGNISATSTTISSCVVTKTTCTSATTTAASTSTTSVSPRSQSQSTSNKYAAPPAATAVGTNASKLSATSATGSSSGENPGTGKASATLPCIASSNPAVQCEGGAAGSGVKETTTGIFSAFTSPNPSNKDSNSHNNNNTSNNTTTASAFVAGGSIVDSSSSSKPLSPNPSFEGKSHQNNQSPPQPAHHESQEKAGGKESSSSSLSTRLSLKNLGKRRSPVRTQFTLPVGSSSTNTTSGADQIPKDSISSTTSSTNTSSLLVAGASGGGASGCFVSNNNSGSGGQTSRDLLQRTKKDRGPSASPPIRRAQSQQPEPAPGPSISLPSSSDQACSSSSTNPSAYPPPITTKTITHPADPDIPWVPGTSAPISVDRVHSVKITRKILHNWRSACGRTRDRTKDLIRRWKTLPENSPDFEQVPPSSPSTTKKKTGSTSNLNSSSPLTKKKVQVTKSSEGTSSGAGATSTFASNEPKELLSLTSCELTKVTSSSKSPSGQQRTTENEMPVVGKGTSSSSGGGDGTGSGGHNSNTGVSGSAGGRLNVGMAGVGRPSISLNNSANVLNGRTNMGDSGGSAAAAAGGPSGGQSKSSTGWTVHVWTTYVQRDDLEQGLDEEEPKKPDREYLSDFQKVKLTHFFRHVLDMNHDDVISAEDFVALNQRIRHYIEWSSECIEFHILKEVHSGFLECFLNQPLDECSVMYYCSSEKETRQNVNIDEWLDVWGGLLQSARTLESLPLWLQYFPKILFQVINKSGSGTISREELRAFYTMFLGIDFRVVNETLEAIHKAMTDGGRHKITYDLFKLCFANFLLGKYPNGPGQYLFGICSPQTLECSFPIDYSALNTHPDDLEPYDPEKDKSQSNRRSVIV